MPRPFFVTWCTMPGNAALRPRLLTAPVQFPGASLNAADLSNSAILRMRISIGMAWHSSADFLVEYPWYERISDRLDRIILPHHRIVFFKKKFRN